MIRDAVVTRPAPRASAVCDRGASAPDPTERRAPWLRTRDAAVLLLPALALVATPAPVTAEDASPPPEEMVVVGERSAAIDVLAGASTTVIDVDASLVEGAGLDDVLAEVPGVQIRRLGGAGEPYEISIRGSSPEQVPIFLDGVRIESALTSRGDLSTICLDVLDEIQVTRGPGAARAGTGAIGGVVNLVSRPPQDVPETRARFAAGNFGTFEGSLRHARPIGDWGVSLAYCGFHTDGDFEYQRARPASGGGASPVERRENNEADRHNALLRLDRETAIGRLRLTQLGSFLERGTPGSDLIRLDRAREENRSILSSLRLDTPFETGGETILESTLAHRYEANDFENPIVLPGQDAIDTETRLHAVTPRLTLRHATPFAEDALEIEASVLAEGRFETRAANEANRKSRAGVALRAEATLHAFDDRLRVSPSLRFERFDGLDAEWIPGLFLEADPIEGLRLKASASRSYRAPSFGELYLPDKGFERGNEDLDAETAWNFEVGFLLESPFASPWLDGEIEATWFAGEVEDSIVFQQVSPNTFSFQNTGRIETRGHEVAIRWRPHDWVRIAASRTVTDATSETDGTPIAGIARSQVDGRLELGPRDRFVVVGEVQYTGRIPTRPGDLEGLASRVVFDASVRADLATLPPLRERGVAASLWLSLRARNLSNTAVRDTSATPRPGRNFMVSIEGVFR